VIKQTSTIRKVNYTATAIVLRTLMEGPASVDELVEAAGLHRVTTYSFMRVLRAHQVVHIAAWEPDRLGRDVMPVFALGAARDRPRRRLTVAQRQAASRARKKMREMEAAIAGAE
jgi:DNA-binding IclR family transcriptional regulator